MMKILWLLLPVSVLWVVFYVGFKFMPSDPIEVWWAIPLFITLAAAFLVSLLAAIIKMEE